MSSSKNSYLAWAEIDLKAIRHNYLQLARLASRQLAPRSRRGKPSLLTVIKADAYGHGMAKAAQLFNRLGVGFFGVSDVAEGIELRKLGINKPILLFESTLPNLAKQLVDYNLTPTVCTLSLASSLNLYAKSHGRKISVHVKIDTGMGRLGVWHSEAKTFIHQLARYNHLKISGLCTHFPVADTNPAFTRNQMEQFKQIVEELTREGISFEFLHAANSMGIVGYKTSLFNLARPGLMLYGLYPSDNFKNKIKLKPAMTVKARVIFTKILQKGASVSYGQTFRAKADMPVATIPIGYSDGYLRSFSNNAAVLIRGKRCPVLGRVTMDQIMVDVSKAGPVRLGDEVVVLGKSGNEEITADELARQSNTINYEVICNLGNQLPRIYKSE